MAKCKMAIKNGNIELKNGMVNTQYGKIG